MMMMMVILCEPTAKPKALQILRNRITCVSDNAYDERYQKMNGLNYEWGKILI